MLRRSCTPGLIKVIPFTFIQIFVKVLWTVVLIIVNFFSSLTIQLSLIASFLNSVCFIFISLMSFNDFFSIFDSSLSFCLVNFISTFNISFLMKMPLANCFWIRIPYRFFHIEIFEILKHLFSHLLHHGFCMFKHIHLPPQTFKN